MQLLFMMSVILAIAGAEGAPKEPIDGSEWRLAGAVGCISAVALLAWVIAQVTALRVRVESNHRNCLRWFDRMRTVHTIVWLLATGAILYGLGWSQLVRWNWKLDGLFLADDLLVLVPVVLPMALSWAAFFDVDRAIAVAYPSGALVPLSRWRYVMLHIRHYFGLLLLPVLLILAADDAWRLLVGDTIALGDSSTTSTLVLLALMVLLAVALPYLIRLVWPMRPLADGTARERELNQILLSATLRWKTPIRKILVWETGDRMVNAAVAGFISRLRFLILSDGLIDQLSKEEIVAVSAHEAGHLYCQHLPLRGVLIALPLGVWSATIAVSPAAHEQIIAAISSLGLAPSAQAALVVPLSIGLYAWFVFGPYCRRLELEADLFACCADSSIETKPSIKTGKPTVAAVTQFQAMLEKLARLGGPRRQTWLHPSIDARCDFLSNMSQDPRKLARFRSRNRLLARTIVLLTLASWAVVLVAG